MGSTKSVYTYNKLKNEKSEIIKYIKGVILLSLIDIQTVLKFYLKDKYDKYVKIAVEKKKEGLENELMSKDCFIYPISVKTFLKYSKDNQEIDFMNYMKDSKLEKLNNIDAPIFMRWGNVNEMILQEARQLVSDIENILINENKDIGYIDGADHEYVDKEEILASEIVKFIMKNK